MPSKGGINIGHVNIFHLQNKLHDVISLLSVPPSLHLLGITETRLSDTKHGDSAVDIQNYAFIRRDAAHHNHTGIGVYVHESIRHAVKRRFDLEPVCVECIWLEVRPHRSSPVLVGFLYRNPACTDEWFNNYIEMMDKVNVCNVSTVLLGDFNINLLVNQPQWNHKTEMLGLTQLIQDPTRVTCTSSTLIDHIYTNNKSMILNASTSSICMSDHKPITCTWSCKRPKVQPKGHTYITYRCFKNFNRHMFLTDLSLANFHLVSDCIDPENAASLFIGTLLSVVDKHAPIRRKRVKCSTIPNWMTKEIITAMQLRDSLKENKQFDDYKKQRNVVSALVKLAKKNYFQKLIRDQNDICQIWRAMNELSNKSRKTQTISNLDITADALNTHFLTLVDTIVDSSLSTNSTDFKVPEVLNQFCKEKNHPSDSFRIPTVTVSEVEQLIYKLNSKKSMDTDNLNSLILKMSLPYIVESLTYVYNLSIEKNVFPSVFKNAKIIPIPKSKDTSVLDNYRPISILSILSKPLERHIHTHLLKYIEGRSLFHPYQSGFRPKHSCHTALTRLCDTWLQAINNRDMVGAVFLDLRKAFDLVDHTILLKKLLVYFQNESSLTFFASYLLDRKQAVYLNGSYSAQGLVKCGVPQGSILGPLLFGLYINDLPLHLKHKDAVIDLFADDSTLHSSNSDIQHIRNVLQESITNISDWCHANRMALHPKKTKSMLITTRQKHQRQPLSLDLRHGTSDIAQVHEHRVLGVVIDDELNWRSHIETVSKRVSKNLFLLNKLWYFVPTDALKMFFHAHCLSHICYASTVWCQTSDVHIKKLNMLHKRGVKILNKDSSLTTKEKYAQLNILPLQQQFILNASVFMFKVYSRNAPSYIQDLFKHPPGRTRLLNYTLPLPRIDLYKSSFAYWGSQVWNSLPASCKKCQTVSSFKFNVRRHLWQ